MDKTKQMNREECQKLFNGSYPFDFNDLWSWIETYSNQQREAILRETRDGITNLISNSDGSVDWFNGLRCARGVVDAAIDSVTKIKEEK